MALRCDVHCPVPPDTAAPVSAVIPPGTQHHWQLGNPAVEVGGEGRGGEGRGRGGEGRGGEGRGGEGRGGEVEIDKRLCVG